MSDEETQLKRELDHLASSLEKLERTQEEDRKLIVKVDNKLFKYAAGGAAIFAVLAFFGINISGNLDDAMEKSELTQRTASQALVTIENKVATSVSQIKTEFDTHVSTKKDEIVSQIKNETFTDQTAIDEKFNTLEASLKALVSNNLFGKLKSIPRKKLKGNSTKLHIETAETSGFVFVSINVPDNHWGLVHGLIVKDGEPIRRGAASGHYDANERPTVQQNAFSMFVEKSDTWFLSGEMNANPNAAMEVDIFWLPILERGS